MTSQLRGWNIDFVAHLEMQHDQLPAIMYRSGIAALRTVGVERGLGAAGKAGYHETSEDPSGARASMVALLRAEPSLRHQRCGLLAGDYDAFGYPFHACCNGEALGPANHSAWSRRVERGPLASRHERAFPTDLEGQAH